jgi:hypothetical protein
LSCASFIICGKILDKINDQMALGIGKSRETRPEEENKKARISAVL